MSGADGALAGKRIGFVGGGAMAEALAGGLLAAGVPPESVRVSDVAPERRAHLERTLGVRATDDNADVTRHSDVVVLAVKPAVVEEALASIAADASVDLTRPLWISIAAGVPLARLERALADRARIVRAMPNTPALVRAAATAYCANARADAADLAVAGALFQGVGVTWEAPEEALLDAVTGLSGSGPAYVFLLLEALVAAGEREGLPHDAAHRLACQTALGAAQLALGSERSPAELREQVTSPGGTTLAGLQRLDALGFREALGEAVAAATRRSKELGSS